MSEKNDLGLLTTDEAGELLRSSRSAVTKLRDEGKLPFINIGSKVYFRRESLIKFVEDQEVIVTNPSNGE